MGMTGGRLCGALRYEITGAVNHAGLCHCTDCQKSTGSAFAPYMGISSADFRYTAWLDFETREVVEQELYEYVSSGVAESKNLAGNQAYVPVQREMGRKLRTILRERIGADAWP